MEKFEIDENMANAIMLIRKHCLETGCNNCGFYSNGCMLNNCPASWEIKEEVRYVVYKGGAD